jgi:hypothetical protein
MKELDKDQSKLAPKDKVRYLSVFLIPNLVFLLVFWNQLFNPNRNYADLFGFFIVPGLIGVFTFGPEATLLAKCVGSFLALLAFIVITMMAMACHGIPLRPGC